MNRRLALLALVVAGVAVAAAGAGVAGLLTSAAVTTVGCGCASTGAYVNPAQGAEPAATATSPHGTYTLTVTGSGTPTLTVKRVRRVS